MHAFGVNGISIMTTLQAATGESVIIGVVFLSLGKSDTGLGALQLHGQSMTSAAPSRFIPNWNRVKVKPLYTAPARFALHTLKQSQPSLLLLLDEVGMLLANRGCHGSSKYKVSAVVIDPSQASAGSAEAERSPGCSSQACMEVHEHGAGAGTGSTCTVALRNFVLQH